MTDATNPDVDLAAINEKIVTLVEAKLAKGQPALINPLGISLGNALGVLKAATGQSLLEYIQKTFSDRYQVILVKENTQGLWHVGQAYEQAVRDFVGRPPRPAPRRFVSSFWDAFIEPLKGARRFYSQGEARFVDADLAPSPEWREIPVDLIYKPGEDRNVREVHRHISEWFERTGEAPDQYLTEVPVETRAEAGRSVLDLLVASLTPKQLQSVTMSLDVVAELARRRV
jgi:hypothetical protein